MYFLDKFEEVYITGNPSMPETLGELGFQSMTD